jgi:AraC family transcriptional regulator, regulatory protein of adaptative response / methylated-DNA-[protein]-cysteine methyltransferase
MLDKMSKLVMQSINTPLGDMVAVASQDSLISLEFADKSDLDAQSKTFRYVIGQNDILSLVEKEVGLYFLGKLQEFSVPTQFYGTSFQIKSWSLLMEISYGHTCSYREQAFSIGGNGYRAVGNANARNKLAILVPCHRVVRSDGSMGGYAGGIARKKWLIEHEKKYSNISLTSISG